MRVETWEPLYTFYTIDWKNR